MLIEVPFSYEVSTTAPRWRSQRQGTRIASMKWNVPEVDGAEAPVALSWDWVVADDLYGQNGSFPCEVRVFDGGFYAPLGSFGENRRVQTPVSADGLPVGDNIATDGLRRIWDLVGYLSNDDPRRAALMRAFFPKGGVTAAEAEQGSSLVSSSIDIEADRVAEALRKLLIVDGKAYSRIEEPRLQLKRWDLPWPAAKVAVVIDPQPSPFSIEEYREGSPASNMYFRMDGFEAMTAQAASLGLPVIMQEVSNLVVHMPDVLHFDAAPQLLRRLAAFAVSVSEENLGKVGRAANNAWHDVKEAVDGYRVEPDIDRLEEAVSMAVPAIIDGLASIGHDRTERLRESFEIWCSSEVKLEVAVAPGGPRPMGKDY